MLGRGALYRGPYVPAAAALLIFIGLGTVMAPRAAHSDGSAPAPASDSAPRLATAPATRNAITAAAVPNSLRHPGQNSSSADTESTPRSAPAAAIRPSDPRPFQRIILSENFLSSGTHEFPHQAEVRVRDLLRRGVGWKVDADISRAYIVRAEGPVERCDLNALCFRNDRTRDIVLRHNDALFVPELREHGVYVLGDVDVPGLHTSPTRFTVRSALEAALWRAAPAEGIRVYLVQGWPEAPVFIRYSGRTDAEVPLRSGDIMILSRAIHSRSIEFWNSALGLIGGPAATIREAGFSEE